MKRFIIVSSFLILLLLSPKLVFAQTSTSTTSSVQTTIPSTTENSPSLWEQFLSWLFGLFIKTDYQISSRPITDINLDMNNYGDINSSDFDKKHSFAGSRLTDIDSQNCLKGNVIKNVVLEKIGYPNSNLSKICSDSADGCIVKSLNDTDSTDCLTISITNLANFFIQFNQPFYCDYINNTNKLMEIEANIITKVQTLNLPAITESQKKCYQQIYDDFYITPKDNTDETEENAKKIIQTPINSSSQDSNKNNIETKKQVDANFTPNDSGWDGLNSLRPASW